MKCPQCEGEKTVLLEGDVLPPLTCGVCDGAGEVKGSKEYFEWKQKMNGFNRKLKEINKQ